jgi:hypothetical protein
MISPPIVVPLPRDPIAVKPEWIHARFEPINRTTGIAIQRRPVPDPSFVRWFSGQADDAGSPDSFDAGKENQTDQTLRKR